MKKHCRRYQRLSVKIVMIILGITIVVSNVSGIGLYRYFSNVMREQMRKDNQVTVNQLSAEIDDIYEEAQKFSQQILINKSVQKYFSEDVPDSVVEVFKQKNEILDYVNQMIMLSAHISSIALIKDEKEMIWTDVPFWDDISMELCREWYGEMNHAEKDADVTGERNQIIVGRPYTFTYTRTKGERQRNLVSIRIPGYSSEKVSERWGSVIINIESETIDNIIQKHSENFDALGYFCEGQEMFYIPDDTLDKKIFEMPEDAEQNAGEKQFPLKFRQETKLGGTLIAVLNYPGLFDSQRMDVQILLLVLLGGVFLIAAILIPLMLRLTRPVSLLTDAMKQVGAGNLETQVEIHTRDEFETLGKDFNQMVVRLNTSVQASLQHEKDKHELEYEVLVAQINPHFIYNTLNTIIYLAKKEQGDDVVKITRALIDLLQDGIKLSDNKNYSFVEEELWIIENYMCIQNYRYKNMFELIVDCPEELKKEQVPTSVIQPLVENALFHGIVPLGQKGRIWLSLRKEVLQDSEDIRICISDEGVGIPEEKVQSIINGSMQLKDASRNHIGVQNIIKRLTLLYGEHYRLTMKARDGGGTEVEIILPFRINRQKE